jgi:hypothetical protein
MLSRAISGAGLVALVTAVLLALCQPAAQAASGPSGGNPFGSVQCGQSYSPSCVVSAGSPGSTTTATAGVTGPDSGTASSGGGCTGTVNAQFGCVPPGCQVTVATLTCPLGVPGAADVPDVLPAAGTLAQLAVRYLELPGPVIRSSPAPGDLQLVHLPVWLWVNPAVWAPVSKTASVPGERVTATATPVSVSWRMGDGTTVTCHGPGVPYTTADNPASASPVCGYTYTSSSAGQPGGAYHVTATITWQIRWVADGGAAGTLPPLFSAAAAAFRVAESQAVNVSGGQG